MRIFVYESKKRAKKPVGLLRRHLLKKIISSVVDIEPTKIILKTNQYGKPELEYPRLKNFDCSLSYSENLMACAVNEGGKVGIDIEKINKVDTSAIQRYFSKEELAHMGRNRKGGAENFYSIWTLREAFMKATGKGFSFPWNKFYFTFAKGKPRLNLIKKNEKNYFFRTYAIKGGYKLAVCSNVNSFPRKVIFIDEL